MACYLLAESNKLVLLTSKILKHQHTAERFFPSSKRHPYYIVAPGFTRYSAGVRVLHTLCHLLNLMGQSAFVHSPSTNFELNTPLLTQDIVNYHYRLGNTPITIYPEILSGNPCNAEFCVRYLLNFAGALGGPKLYPQDDYIVSFSRDIQNHYPNPSRLICIPTSDPDVYNRIGEPGMRDKECYYINKRLASGMPLKSPPQPSWIRVPTARDANQLSREELAMLYRSAKRLYIYEVSSVALDAILCGCPVVLMKEDLETDWMQVEELADDGIALSNTPHEIQRAEQTVGKVFENYCKWFQSTGDQIEVFIDETQAIAKTKRNESKFRFDMNPFQPPRAYAGRVDRYIHSTKRYFYGVGRALMGDFFGPPAESADEKRSRIPEL
jgi:hypothetical protein